MKRKISQIVLMLAVVVVLTAFSPDAQAADMPGLIGGQFGSEDFTDLEHMESLSSLDCSWGQGDGFGQQWSAIWEGNIVAAGSGKVTITAETDNRFVRISKSGTYGGRQSKPHGPKSPGGQPSVRFGQLEILGGPHLVLPDVGRHDRIPILRQLV